MTKVFVKPEQVNGDLVRIIGADLHHLRSVLRKEIGDSLLIGINDRTYNGVIVSSEPEQMLVSLVSSATASTESTLTIQLCQAIAKGDKMDLIIQKAVELGVNEIVPFVSQHTVVKLDADKRVQKQSRWQKIAEEAAKQCKRDRIPQVRVPVDYNDLLTQLQNPHSEHLILMAYERASEHGLKQLAGKQPQRVSIIIGPEGGFAPHEVESVAMIGGEIIKLGNRILRTETAAIAVLSLVQYIWGDLG